MGWEDDGDDWPGPDTDPDVIARKRENARVAAARATRAVRLVYATLAVLLVIVIVLAIAIT